MKFEKKSAYRIEEKLKLVGKSTALPLLLRIDTVKELLMMMMVMMMAVMMILIVIGGTPVMLSSFCPKVDCQYTPKYAFTYNIYIFVVITRKCI